MTAIKHILVPRDFSACSEQALRYALDLAGRTGATVHLLSATILYADGPPPLVEERTATREALRERLMEGLAEAAPGVRFEVAVVRGLAAAPLIVAYANAQAIDLIVMGTHGRRGVRHLLLGSVAEEVVRTASCPVLTTRAAAPAPPAHPTLLVPVDFSEHARLAVRHARRLAASLEARLVLLHVIEDQIHPAFYGPTVQSIYDLVPDIEARSLRELEAFFHETDGPAVAARFAVRYGAPVREIVAAAQAERANLIVMATHGLRGLEHALLGSVAEKVVRRSPVPVLTMRPPGQTPAPPPEHAEADAVV